MATDAGGTRPLTQFVAGNGQSSVSYQLPAGLFQYIQSVVATIDTSASGDVTPLLTVRDDAQIVVADKQQDDAIDAGGSGRATWALRLTANGAGVRFNKHNRGGFFWIDAAGFIELDATGASGDISLSADKTVEIVANTRARLAAVDDVRVNAGTALTETGDTITRTAVDSITDTAGAGGYQVASSGSAALVADVNVIATATVDVAISYGSTYSVSTTGADRAILVSSVGGTWGEGIHNFVDTGFPFDVFRRDSALDPFPAPRFRVENNGQTSVLLKAGATLLVTSETAGAVFRVDSNGDLHGKTGKALTFDL